MKKLFLALFSLVTSGLSAQSFEGTIQWSMTMEYADPAMKAKMENAQRRMQDPAMQAKMKEMQQRMNDPQMKAIMESNPQMKAQMEKAMTGDVGNVLPTGMKMKVKGASTITTMEGGMSLKDEVLFIHDKDLIVMLDRTAKTYRTLSSGNTPRGSNAVKVTKTAETMKVLNFNCTKYVAEVTEKNSKITQTFWTTQEIKDINFQSFAKQRMSQGGSMYPEGLEGVPLRIEMQTQEGRMIMEVTSIKRETHDALLFTLPPDYRELK
ncbi:MAG: DUF4412 domain-containing protein [Cyclobacteriaceae bacterium]|nr:DUF4412 domain-containing protein [Cyclobacteriaceae bacterium]